MNDDVLNTAVLIIGKTGVGKSSLLNYMFGEHKCRTGTGKPVTSVGLFEYCHKFKEDFHINIYDSWGLEADKAEKWRELIWNEVRQHDKKDISEWFNTIIFCISANSTRVEEFETEMIKELVKQKNNIVVAITHCRTTDPNENAEMIGVIEKETGISRKSIVNVSSVCVETLGGTKTEQFGRDEIFTAITENLWQSICSKLRLRLKEDMNERLEASKIKQLNKIKKTITPGRVLIDRLSKKTSPMLEKLGEETDAEISELIERERAMIQDKLINANEYYFKLYNQYSSEIVKAQRMRITVAKCDFIGEYRAEIEGVINSKGLKNIRETVEKIFRKNDQTEVQVFAEIVKKIMINQATIKEKRFNAGKTVSALYGDIEEQFIKHIDKSTDQISKAYCLEAV